MTVLCLLLHIAVLLLGNLAPPLDLGLGADAGKDQADAEHLHERETVAESYDRKYHAQHLARDRDGHQHQ